MLIAVAGGSASGKTWLVERLVQHWGGGRSGRLALDDFYRDRSGVHPALRARINFDHPRAIDWQLFEQTLICAAGGRPCLVPKYDFGSHLRRQRWNRLEPIEFLLIDGLWPWRPRRFRSYFHVKIYMACADKLRLERRIVRDVAERGRKAGDVRQQYIRDVRPAHERFVEPLRQNADIVVHSPVSPADIPSLARQIEEIRKNAE